MVYRLQYARPCCVRGKVIRALPVLLASDALIRLNCSVKSNNFNFVHDKVVP